MTSSKREETSPILKKAGAALQLRSMYFPSRKCSFRFILPSAFIEHSTAGEGLPLSRPSFSSYVTHDEPVRSAKAPTKSKFCATAHVEYTESGSAVITSKATIKVRNGCCCRSDPFRKSAEQCLSVFISTDTNCTPYPCASTDTGASATKTRFGSPDNIAGPHRRCNIIPKLDTDLNIEPIFVLHVCIRTTARRFLRLTVGVRGRVASLTACVRICAITSWDR